MLALGFIPALADLLDHSLRVRTIAEFVDLFDHSFRIRSAPQFAPFAGKSSKHEITFLDRKVIGVGRFQVPGFLPRSPKLRKPEFGT